MGPPARRRLGIGVSPGQRQGTAFEGTRVADWAVPTGEHRLFEITSPQTPRNLQRRALKNAPPKNSSRLRCGSVAFSKSPLPSRASRRKWFCGGRISGRHGWPRGAPYPAEEGQRALLFARGHTLPVRLRALPLRTRVASSASTQTHVTLLCAPCDTGPPARSCPE